MFLLRVMPWKPQLARVGSGRPAHGYRQREIGAVYLLYGRSDYIPSDS